MIERRDQLILERDRRAEQKVQQKISEDRSKFDSEIVKILGQMSSLLNILKERSSTIPRVEITVPPAKVDIMVPPAKVDISIPPQETVQATVESAPPAKEWLFTHKYDPYGRCISTHAERIS